MISFRSLITHTALSLLLAAPMLTVAQEKPAAPAASATTAAPVIEGVALKGAVIETMNSSGYTYLLLDAAQGKIWVAIPETQVKTGQTVTCGPGMVMKNFTSKSLNRTFENIVFSPGLDKGISASAPPSPTPSAAGKGGAGFSEALQAENSGGKMAKTGGTAIDENAAIGSAGSAGAIVPSTAVNVNKATGPNSYSVGECFEQAKELNTKTVRVRGKIMKISRMIMGKNWLHIQDGTGNPLKNQHDLVVTTMDTPEENTVVTVEGVLSANRDFGAGYKYDIIIEDAKVEK
jgi:hypothetical protein